jgi:ubiquitin-protein ligase
MSINTAVARLQRDVKEVFQRFGYNSDNPPIFVLSADDRVDYVYTLVVGPPDTPYDGGLMLFTVSFPPTYPNSPPNVEFSSTCAGTVRLNPNLYASGKVCLSILGTWQGEASGAENWRSTYSLAYVLQCVQCMILNGEPYYNEPGFEKDAVAGLASGACPAHGFGFMVKHSNALSATDAAHPAPVGTADNSMSPQPTGMDTTESDVLHAAAESVAEVPEEEDDALNGSFPSPSKSPAVPSEAASPLNDVVGPSSAAPCTPALAKSVSPETSLATSQVPSPSGNVSPASAAVAHDFPQPAGAKSASSSASPPGKALPSTPPPSATKDSSRRVQLDMPTAARIKASVEATSEAYTLKIHHETLRVTVCDTLEAIFNVRNDPAASAGNKLYTMPAASAFQVELKRLFRMRYPLYRAAALHPPSRPAHQRLAEQFPRQALAALNTQPLSAAATRGEPPVDGEPFEVMPFEGGRNSCTGTFSYSTLATRLDSLRETVDRESASWADRGAVATQNGTMLASTLLSDASLLTASSGSSSGGPAHVSNAFVWTVTLMPTSGTYADSAYIVDVLFHPEGCEPPRCTFRQPIWHPNVNALGVPFDCLDESTRGASRYRPAAVIESLCRLLVDSPVNTPAAILNREAGSQAFAVDPEQLKTFKRKARALAQRTMEG